MRHVRVLVPVVAALLAGCYGQVQRDLTVESEPSGARFWLNDNEVGRTPVTVPFTWYGTYDVRLEHPGYAPLDAEADVNAPWFQWIPLDLAFETVVPGVHHDGHVFRFEMVPAEPADEAALLERAEAFRQEALEPEVPPDTPAE